MRRLSFALLVTLLAGPLAALPAVASVPAYYFGGLHYRLIGPFRGGRALAVTGVVGEPNHFYFGAVDGGVWESTNAGRTWSPIFDAQDVGSIGAIAVAPSDPRIVYVGTGEADMRSDIAAGDGMYRSDDAGRTWRHIGLRDSRQIGSIVVDPHDPNVVYVAALGHQYGSNAERGVFKTVDGGAHWSKVLYLNESTGAIDLAMSPSDPQTLLAAMWQTRRPPWNVYPPSNGPSSGLYVTHDGGATWSHVTAGLPTRVGRIGISYSETNPRRVYAVVDSDVAHGGIYRSDDGGATWAKTNGDVRLWQRGWYFGGITADPKDESTVYVMDTSVYRSTDGGRSFTAIKGDPTGDDFHTLWVDPNDDRRMILGSDQGVVVSVDRAATWTSWFNQPTAQLYHVSADDRFPFWVYAAQQDSGALALPSTGRYSTLSMMDFRPIDAGGENGYLVPAAGRPGYVYGTGGTLTLENVKTGWERSADPTLVYPKRVWRSTWTTPLAISPVDHALYYARQNLFYSRDGGASWRIISGDLSRVHTPPLPNLDPATKADTNGLTRHGVIYAIAPSTEDARTIWVGTDDGYVWITRDRGAHWRNVTPSGVTAWSKVGIIDASHFDAGTAYIAVDRHRLDDDRPYIYRTSDFGRTWQRITNGIPSEWFVNVVRADPLRRGLLYAGTERGIVISFDNGNHWQPFQLNLPSTSVRDIVVHDDDVIVATHGRGIYILDDISRLRQMSVATATHGGAFLFAPATAYRLRRVGYDEGTPLPPDEPQAQDAPVGALVDYLVRTPGTVEIQILDEHGALLRSWSSAHPSPPVNPLPLDFPPSWAPVPPVPSAALGGHRFIWNFRTGDGRGPLAPPGRYFVRLIHDGRSQTQGFTVLKDPRIAASVADLRAQYTLAQSIAARLSEIAAMRKHTHDPRILGVAPSANPNDSVGAASQDLTSLRALHDDFENLEASVESADAAPTADMRRAYTILSAMLAKTERER
ncbi:MAG: WD40/YVTN/BNR-like repeat-containing protein [Candidatus Tyrphobacter sp.]